MSAESDDQRYLPWSPSCAEYFKSYRDGRFHERSQLWFILPIQDISIDPRRSALVVGSAGADSIDFCFRRGHAGVWAYYPYENEWVLKANSLAELERGWLEGTIGV